MDNPILSLKNYGVAFGRRTVLSSVTLDIPERGIFVLLGPAGTGKSTLLRTLAGFNSANPSLHSWGEARYSGAPLGDEGRPTMVMQNVKLLMASILENIISGLPERHTLSRQQQREIAARLLARANLDSLLDKLDDSAAELGLGLHRHLAIVRSAASNPRLLFVDEPTANVDEDSSMGILDCLQREAERRAVLVVVHNQKHARVLGGRTALLAGGWIQETQATEDFFAHPQTRAAKDFVRSGTCSVPSPDAKPEELDDGGAPTPPPAIKRARPVNGHAFGPRGFLWLKKGKLAGTPRPGVVVDIRHDLEALRRVGITCLISLTQRPIDTRLLSGYGIQGIWRPVRDMGAPSKEIAMSLCARISELMDRGEAVAVHCRAGLGRTGTLLAAQLIWEGQSALDALETVRRIEPRWVQSDEQTRFLEQFAQALGHTGVCASGHSRSKPVAAAALQTDP